MRKLIITLSLMLLLAVYSNSAVVFGGEGTFLIPLMVNIPNIPDTKSEFDLSFLPRITVYNNIFELSGEGSIRHYSSAKILSFNINELFLTMNITDEWLLKVGRFLYLPGTAEFFSNNNAFGPLDFEKLLTGNVKNASQTSDILQTKLFWNSMYVVITVEPVPRFTQVPRYGSSWFPMKDFPTSFPNLLLPSKPDLQLENVSIADFPDDFTLRDSSFGMEAGITTSFADFTFLYFHGLSKNPLYQAEMIFPQGWFQNYDIKLYRVKEKVTILGCTSAATFDSFRFWEDAAFYFGRTFATSRLSENSLQTALTFAPSLSATTGASWEYYGSVFNTMLLAEYEHTFVFSSDTSIQLPAFSNILSLLTRVSFPSMKTSYSLLSLFSTLDKSFLVNTSIDLTLSDELDFSLVVPVFWGDIKTDFGQFRDNHPVTASITWRF